MKLVDCSTLSFYNPVEYEEIGLVHGMSVHAISFGRQLLTNITSLVGQRQEMIETKVQETQRDALNDMIKNGEKLGAVKIVGVSLQTGEISRRESDGFITATAMGTALRKKKKNK